MEVEGKIIKALEKRTGTSKATGKDWALQEYILQTLDPMYPKKICFQVFGDDKIGKFNIKVGETLKVAFNIDSREFKDNWYTTISAWRVSRAMGTGGYKRNEFGGGSSIPQTSQGSSSTSTVSADDLPF